MPRSNKSARSWLITAVRREDQPVPYGWMEKLEEIDYDGGVKVEVAVSAQMVQISTGATVWTNSVSEVGQAENRDVPGVVSEMSRTMERAIEKLLTPAPALSSE